MSIRSAPKIYFKHKSNSLGGEMPYAFDLKQVCGGYAYFSVYTHGSKPGDRGFERRIPSEVYEGQFVTALAELGQQALQVNSDESYRNWLCIHGWALVDCDYAERSICQWLSGRQCIKSPFGSFTDRDIASPKMLSRSYRGQAREQILDRDGRRCLRCHAPENLTLQHVLPFSLGGETNSRNLVTLCEPCNQELKNEIDSELYQLAGLTQGMELSLLRVSPCDDRAMIRARQFSANIMHTRCEVW
ncbi:hypothetical protein PSO31014_04385 [Pandoraea soli]|nr:hypothetical protein PSO31014_04385 [Pandoraea soli]